MMIRRILKNKIESNLSLKKAVIILGARQVGKTTLLEEIIANRDDTIFFNGDEPDIRELLSNSNSTQISNMIGPATAIIIDEAQLIPNVGITLKLITDRFPDVQLFVSGSSSLELVNNINEPLTGRKLEYQLFPLSFKEMVDHHGFLTEKRNIKHRMIFGYYPDIVNNVGNEILLLKNLAGSYLYKDILSLGEIKKPVVLDKLLRALALQLGSEVSYNELSKTVGADKETIEKYIDLLEKAYVVFRLNGLNRNVRNEIKKGKKVYFYDNGIRNAIIGNFTSLDNRTDSGALWENFIISERIKYLNYNNFYGHYYFWRTTQQQEIDFIEEQDGTFSAYEFKLNPAKKSSFSKTFTRSYNIKKTEIISPENLELFLL
jgi:hypothetical protein